MREKRITQRHGVIPALVARLEGRCAERGCSVGLRRLGWSMGQRGCDAADRRTEMHGVWKKGEAERKQRGSAVSGKQEKQARGNQHPRRDRGCPVGLAGSGWRGLVHRAEQGISARWRRRKEEGDGADRWGRGVSETGGRAARGADQWAWR